MLPNYYYVFPPANKFSQAVELYDQAIDLNGSNAVYWANRAFAHTKLEEYGSAVQDATKAIEIDPKYSKVSIYDLDLLLAKKILGSHLLQNFVPVGLL